MRISKHRKGLRILPTLDLGWQSNDECGSAAELAFHVNSAAMVGDNAPAFGESEAKPTTRRATGIERIE